MQTGRDRPGYSRPGGSRAIAACLAPRDAGAMARVLGAAGFELVGTAGSAGEALERVRSLKPELLLADAVLPGGDGASLAARIASLPLELYPAILLMRPEGLNIPGAEGLEALGAAVIARPASVQEIRDAVSRLESRTHRLPPDKAARLSALLDALGVPAHPGREMLSCAVALAWRDRRRIHNLRDFVYPAAAAPLGKTAVQAERAIRHVIDAAWRTGEIERQHQIFGDTIDARRGRPTCGEMIAQLADILRWEGRP